MFEIVFCAHIFYLHYCKSFLKSSHIGFGYLTNKFQIRSILNTFNDRLFEREYIKISYWVPNSNINQTKQRSTSTTRLLITLPSSLECFIKNTKNKLVRTLLILMILHHLIISMWWGYYFAFFFPILKHRHPPIKLRICPWTLKNSKFATGLKISYLYSNLIK